MMILKSYVKDERRQKDSAGTEFQHLADIVYDDRVFVVYRVLNGPKAGESFIEEKVTHKYSDMIWGQTELRWIANEHLWQLLFEKAVREGVFK